MLRRPPAAPLEFEAMAAELNPRGTVYQAMGLEFPPGEWVTVTEQQATTLRRLDWATLREKPEAGNG